MLHRIQIDGISREGQCPLDIINRLNSLDPSDSSDASRKLQGPTSNPRLHEIMLKSAMPKPIIANKRARFYFTDLGWHKVGSIIFHEAKSLGHLVKYTRI